MPPLTRVQDVLVSGDATFQQDVQVKGDVATTTITIGHTILTEDQLKKLLTLVE